MFDAEGLFEKVLTKFGMMESKPVVTPLSSQFKLKKSMGKKTEEEISYMSKISYANIVGFIMYTMVCTRPNLSHAISVVSRLMADPCRENWFTLKWLLRYVKEIVNKGLVFGNDSGPVDCSDVVTGFVDSNFVGCLDNRKSLTSYVFTTYGTTISWKATLQKVVALSTTGAEYMALFKAVEEALWLLVLVNELKLRQQQIIVFYDNQWALQLSKNQVFRERTKHIDVKIHFIREIVASGSVLVEKVSTEENPSDMITNQFQAVSLITAWS